MTTFRRILTLCIALLLMLQLPLAALAIEVDTSYGNVTIANEDVTHYTSETSGPVTEAHGGDVVVTHGSGEIVK